VPYRYILKVIKYLSVSINILELILKKSPTWRNPPTPVWIGLTYWKQINYDLTYLAYRDASKILENECKRSNNTSVFIIVNIVSSFVQKYVHNWNWHFFISMYIQSFFVNGYQIFKYDNFRASNTETICYLFEMQQNLCHYQ